MATEITPGTAEVNIEVNQGESLAIPLTLSAGGDPLDLTGCSFALMARKNRKATGDPLISLTTAGGGIPIIDATAGKAELRATDEQAAAWPPGSYVYDLELTFADGSTRRIFEGSLTVRPEVTR